MKLKKQIINAPKSPGVYQFFDQKKQILYVGKAKNLKKRLSNYLDLKRLNNRISRMVSLAENLEIIPTSTESEALLLECNLIKKLKPRYNILLRDDKSFPYILITDNHNYPQITKHRGKKTIKGHYFGPFASANDVNTTIDILKKAFHLRSCSDSEFKRRTKPCLEYQIKRCSGPCVNLIEKADYKELVKEAIEFLNGKNNKIQEELANKMRYYSQNQQYEKAAIMRDRIKALSSIQAKQNINLAWLKNTDIITLTREADWCCIYISFYRNGHNYGSKPYFINITSEISEPEIMSAFLTQFYSEQSPPKTIILSHEADDKTAINEFLNNIAKTKIEITTPKKGEKLALIQNYLELAKQQLQSKLDKQINHKTILSKLKILLNLTNDIEKIEVYDNSHISGQYMVGAMIAAGIEGFIKNSYRKFNIRKNELEAKGETSEKAQFSKKCTKKKKAAAQCTKSYMSSGSFSSTKQFKENGGFSEVLDDTAMLKQVLRRRFTSDKADNRPDLIIIDGGKGQLSAAKTVFDELGIKDQTYICMSKGPNRNAGEEYFHQIGKESFTLPKTNPLMYYLQTLRDEAHRFAIGTHRKKRAKSMIKSELDEINDIGKTRKSLLLNHFGSVAAIKEASLEDLSRIQGISKNIAQKIKDHFSN